ncbi:MAG: nucleotide exchange factor GrpE [Euryarchaeota archaeon]|jgi:molecular chaperone GrpE|nr:nucleotide exchange factor GrpE [Euryarchaeota archaeon]
MPRKTKKAIKEPAEEAEVEVADPLAAAQAELGEVQEQLHRVAADFDNFRKRVERDRSRDALRARGAVATPFLEVLETAAQAAEASYPDVEAAVAGLTGIQRQLQAAMDALGLEAINPAGQFDHRLHEALSAVEREDLEEETIIEVVQPGYLLQGELLRPARVIVSRTPQPATEIETTE